MGRIHNLAGTIALGLSYAGLAMASTTIGPTADLTISNADVAPDGYTRAAVVMNGELPGPIITGNKVCFAVFTSQCPRLTPGMRAGRHVLDQRH